MLRNCFFIASFSAFLRCLSSYFLRASSLASASSGLSEVRKKPLIRGLVTLSFKNILPPCWNPPPKRGAIPKLRLFKADGPPIALTAFLFKTYSPSSNKAGFLSPVRFPEMYIPFSAPIIPPRWLFPAPLLNGPLMPIPIRAVTLLMALSKEARLMIFKNSTAEPLSASLKLSALSKAVSIAFTMPSLKARGKSSPSLP